MAKVDFYQLSSASRQNRNIFLCKLIEKVYLRKHQLYIHCQDQQEAQLLDELLWTYRDTSFIPHNLIGEGPNEAPPIQLGCNTPPAHNDVLINLAQEIPEFYKRFKRILEVAENTEENKIRLQERLNFYQQQNFETNTHNITQD